MSNTYIKHLDKVNIQKIDRILGDLPYYCQEFMASIQNTSSTLTRLNYAHDLRLFFYYLTNELHMRDSMNKITCGDLSQLRFQDFEIYLNWLTIYVIDGKESRNSVSGKNRKLASLRSFFKFLYKCEYVPSVELSKVETPKIHEKEIVRLEEDEVSLLLREVECPQGFSDSNTKYIKNMCERDLAIMYMFLTTGIRISELVGLDLDDINFKENAFKVIRKGGNSSILYFPNQTRFVLLDYLNVRKGIQTLKGHENALFLSTQRRRISVRAVENLVQKYTKNVVGLKKISPHKLRSTFGTNLYRKTKDIYVVATMLGHKDVNTTKKHYAAISEDIKKEVASDIKLKK